MKLVKYVFLKKVLGINTNPMLVTCQVSGVTVIDHCDLGWMNFIGHSAWDFATKH